MYECMCLYCVSKKTGDYKLALGDQRRESQDYLAQSFEGARRGSVYVHLFRGVSTRVCMCMYCVCKKIGDYKVELFLC
jgi:hypothetical protein